MEEETPMVLDSLPSDRELELEILLKERDTHITALVVSLKPWDSFETRLTLAC